MQKRIFHIFPSCRHIEYVAMDILGLLPKSTHRNQYVIVRTYRYSKITREVPSPKSSTTQATNIFSGSMDSFDWHTKLVLTDKGLQFVSKYYKTICGYLVKHTITTAYYPQANGQIDRYNWKTAKRLRHYITYQPRNWDIHEQPLNYSLGR